MADYGTLYQSGTEAFWGATAGQDFACELVEERVLVQHPDATGERQFRDWLCAFVQQAGHYLDVADDVRDGFNLETAVGEQLDLIGSLVKLPRSGFDDARYRTLLEIQVNLLIAARNDQPDWVGTHNNILKICRTFIGDGVPDPVVLLNTPPYSYTLSVPGVTIAELDLLITFICRATWAGVLGYVIVLPSGGGDNNWASTHGAVSDSGIWCSTHGAVAGCALWSHVVTIGNEPC